MGVNIHLGVLKASQCLSPAVILLSPESALLPAQTHKAGLPHMGGAAWNLGSATLGDPPEGAFPKRQPFTWADFLASENALILAPETWECDKKREGCPGFASPLEVSMS